MDTAAARWRSSHLLSTWRRKRAGDPSSREYIWLLSLCTPLHQCAPLHHVATSCHHTHLLYSASGHQKRIPSQREISGLILTLAHAVATGGADGRTVLDPPTYSSSLHPDFLRCNQGNSMDFFFGGEGPEPLLARRATELSLS